MELRSVLFRFNIVVDDFHFHHLMAKIDEDDDGEVQFNEFLRFFGKGGADDKNLGSQIKNMPGVLPLYSDRKLTRI